MDYFSRENRLTSLYNRCILKWYFFNIANSKTIKIFLLLNNIKFSINRFNIFFKNQNIHSKSKIIIHKG